MVMRGSGMQGPNVRDISGASWTIHRDGVWSHELGMRAAECAVRENDYGNAFLEVVERATDAIRRAH